MWTTLYRRNVGQLDRWIRGAVGSVLVVVGLLLMGPWNDGSTGSAVALVGLAGMVSGITGRCPLYVPFGISTICRDSGRGPARDASGPPGEQGER
jgi:hypothetical protein